MTIQFHSPVLFTKNLNDMKHFYQSIMGQDIENDFGNCVSFSCGLTLWELKSGYPIVKHIGYQYSSSGNRNLELCFETEDFNEAAARIAASGARLLHDVTEEKWGQLTIRVYDPDSNIVELGETLRCFVRRMAGRGMSASAIHEKTGIALEQVRAWTEDTAS